MTDAPGTSALRLAAPNPAMYETSGGELAALRGITPDTMGAMYGLLLNQQTRGRNAQYDYNQQLGLVNAQQAGLAQEHMRDARNASQRDATLGLVKEGLPFASALNAMRLDGLPGFLNPTQAAQGVLNGDRLRQLATESKAYEAAGAGAQHAAEAGYMPNLGQAVSGAQGIIDSNLTTQAPLDLQVEALKQAGDRAKAHAQDGKVRGTFNPLNDEFTYQSTGNEDQVFNSINRLRTRQRELENGTTAANGGNIQPVGAGAAAPGRRPAAPPAPSAPAARRSGPASAEEVALARRLEPRIGTYVGLERDRRGTTIIGSKGRYTIPAE